MNSLTPLDVVLAGVRVGQSTDPRPCIVVAVIGDGAVLVPCSAQRDLYRAATDLPIPEGHPNFTKTGLKGWSYAIECSPIYVEKAMIKKRYGRLEGELAKAFKD